MIGNFDNEYGKVLSEIIDRQLRNSVYLSTRDPKEHEMLVAKGWDEISGDESTGWVMRLDVPAGSTVSEAKGTN